MFVDCEASVSPDDDFRRTIPVYTTQRPPERITRRASAARQAKSSGASDKADSPASLPRSTAVSSRVEAVAVSTSSLQRVPQPSVTVSMNGRASSDASVDGDNQSSPSRSRETLAPSTACFVTSHEDGRRKDAVTDLAMSCVSRAADSRAVSAKSNGTTSTSL